MVVGPSLLVLLAAAIGGYVCGTFPSGLVFGRLFGLGDIRKIGSGNLGATNALRTGNRWMALLTLLGDVLKGMIPVLIAGMFGSLAAAVAGLAAFLGHLYPVWLRFRGGKGVATYIGVLLGIAPIGVVVFAVSWLSTAWLTRFSSLAALIATLLVPLVYFFLDLPAAAALTAIMTAFVYIKHRGNIQRLLAGVEPKIGAKA